MVFDCSMRSMSSNAVNGEVARGMEACIDKMEADENVWIGIITANTEGQKNPVFCAGADLKAVESGRGSELGTQRGGFGGIVYRQRRKPIIIAVWVSTGWKQAPFTWVAANPPHVG